MTKAEVLPDTLNIADKEARIRTEKLILEIELLKLEKKYNLYTKPLTVLGSALGLCAVLWTIFQGFRTVKLQYEQRKDSKISTLLTLISDEKPEKRASGAKGLTRYPTEVYHEILTSLRIESVEFVRDIFEDILLKLPVSEFQEIFKANQDTLSERVRLVGGLSTVTELGGKFDVTEALLNFSERTRIMLVSRFQYHYDQGKRISSLEFSRLGKIPDSEINIKEQLISQAHQSVKIAKSTARVITKKLAIFPELKNISGLDLHLSSLYRLKIHDGNFTNSIFSYSLCRHSDFTRGDFSGASFENSDMFDCILNDSTLLKTIFVNTILRKSSVTNANINCANFSDAVIAESSFTGSICIDTKFNRIKANGASFENSNLVGCFFHVIQAKGTNFAGSHIKKTEFFGSNLRATDFSNCTLENVKFNGCELPSANFSNAVLRNVDFSGADLKNIKIDNWTIENCTFAKVKNFSASA